MWASIDKLAMGNPGPEYNHSLHGELPNVPYQHAFIRAGPDERGAFLEVRGMYSHLEAGLLLPEQVEFMEKHIRSLLS